MQMQREATAAGVSSPQKKIVIVTVAPPTNDIGEMAEKRENLKSEL